MAGIAKRLRALEAQCEDAGLRRMVRETAQRFGFSAAWEASMLEELRALPSALRRAEAAGVTGLEAQMRFVAVELGCDPEAMVEALHEVLAERGGSP